VCESDKIINKNFGLNVNSDKCVVMKLNWKTGGMENIKSNNHEIKEVECLKYLGSKIVINGNFKEEITKRVKNVGKCSELESDILWKWLRRGKYAYLKVTTCIY
jgi:hypothetical protein